jgi:hypothetical protein
MRSLGRGSAEVENGLLREVGEQVQDPEHPRMPYSREEENNYGNSMSVLWSSAP